MKKVLFWVTDVDLLLEGSSKVAGIQLQQSIWAKIFIKNGWQSFCLTTDKKDLVKINGITFVPYHIPNIFIKCHLAMLAEVYLMYKILTRIKPEIVICRGSGSYLFFLSKLSKILGVKLVFFSASDVNFVQGKDTINNSALYTYMYRKALYKIDYFVTQNALQSTTLNKTYGKSSMTMFNIWPSISKSNSVKKIYDAIWIANFRKLKRAEWFLNLAKNNPKRRFLICGGPLDRTYFEQIARMSSCIPNIEFVGPKSLDDTSTLISQSKLLVCTSEYEGFPNTFIQAWALGVPVISTVDPSSIISNYDLGLHVCSEQELHESFIQLMMNENLLCSKADNIRNYFINHHSADFAYAKLISYIQ